MIIQKKSTSFAIQDVLPGIIARISSGNAAEQITAEQTWNRLAGSDAGKSVYKGIKDGNMLIQVDSPARLYQWKIRKAEILREMQKYCPEVKNIFFKIGKVK